MRLYGDAEAFCRVRYALARQTVVRDGEATALLSEDILMRNAQVFELDFCRILSGAQRMDDAPHVEAFPFGLDDKGGDTASARSTGAGEQEAVIGSGGTTDPKLRPV